MQVSTIHLSLSLSLSYDYRQDHHASSQHDLRPIRKPPSIHLSTAPMPSLPLVQLTSQPFPEFSSGRPPPQYPAFVHVQVRKKEKVKYEGCIIFDGQ